MLDYVQHGKKVAVCESLYLAKRKSAHDSKGKPEPLQISDPVLERKLANQLIGGEALRRNFGR
ncbi:MAG: hypothetical protein R3B47_05910 [Bacteroidia bacterium]